MSSLKETIHKTAALAYLNLEPKLAQQLEHDIHAIMQLANVLRPIDTNSVLPLLHPLDGSQKLRPDVPTLQDETEKLQHIAPAFSDGLYWVPRVIGK